MARRSCVTASLEQMSALKELARSERRDGSGSGARNASVAGGLDQRGDRDGVRGYGGTRRRHWRESGTRPGSGVEGLRAAVVSGPSGERGLRALSIAAAILSEPVENRPNWSAPAAQGPDRAAGAGRAAGHPDQRMKGLIARASSTGVARNSPPLRPRNLNKH